jgi:cation transport ATPase
MAAVERPVDRGIAAERAAAARSRPPGAAELVRIGLVASFALAGRLGLWEPLFEFDVFSLLAALAGGYPILREATEAVWHRRMTMKLSMSIAVLAAQYAESGREMKNRKKGRLGLPAGPQKPGTCPS